jgi:hypothetical protein
MSAAFSSKFFLLCCLGCHSNIPGRISLSPLKLPGLVSPVWCHTKAFLIGYTAQALLLRPLPLHLLQHGCSGLGPPSDQRIAFVFKFYLNLLGWNCPRLNWDEISEMFQRTPNPGLKFWYRGIDCRYRHQRKLKLFGIQSVIITPLRMDESLLLSKLHFQSRRIFL